MPEEWLSTKEPSCNIPKKSYIQRLVVYNGTYTTESFHKIFLRPFGMIILPAGESNEGITFMLQFDISLALCLCSVLGRNGMVCDYWLFRSAPSAPVVRFILTMSCAVAISSNYSVAFGAAPYNFSSLNASLVGY